MQSNVMYCVVSKCNVNQFGWFSFILLILLIWFILLIGLFLVDLVDDWMKNTCVVKILVLFSFWWEGKCQKVSFLLGCHFYFGGGLLITKIDWEWRGFKRWCSGSGSERSGIYKKKQMLKIPDWIQHTVYKGLFNNSIAITHL